MLINDNDCDAEYPEILKEEEAIANTFHPQRPTVLQASIYIARLLQPLAHLCRSLCIPVDSIRNFEMHLGACMQMFPAELSLQSQEPLDPLVMAPLITFQNTRIILHRHNMSPACSPEQRSFAIENCSTAAEDTATVFSRCFGSKTSVEQVENRLRFAATALMCTHVWRCLLFLAFRQNWAAFRVLLRFASIVADLRPINISCGRYLSSFLDCLVERFQQESTVNLEEDAEIIVLLSGDLQAGPKGWVWDGNEMSAPVGQNLQHPPNHESEPNAEWLASREKTLSDGESQNWGGWGRIAQVAHYLEQLQRSQQLRATVRQVPGQNVAEGRFVSPKSELDQSVSESKSRMAIARITEQ